MLKPDAVHRNLVGEIIGRIEEKGYKMVNCKFMKATEDLLRKHYEDLSKKPFFPGLVGYMASGPVVPMVFQGLNAVSALRSMLGATNPKDSDPGTLRGDFCIDVGRNIIHASDSVESAKKEIGLWFGQEEFLWKPCDMGWIYEDEEEPKSKEDEDNKGKKKTSGKEVDGGTRCDCPAFTNFPAIC